LIQVKHPRAEPLICIKDRFRPRGFFCLEASGKRETKMNASDIMSARVVTVSAEAAIIEAAQLMLENGVSGVPAVDKDGRLVGMVTEGDLFRRCEIGTESDPRLQCAGPPSDPDTVRRFVKSHGRHVKDIMTRDVVRVFEDTPLARLAALLDLKKIKRVPVMRDGRIVGIVSRADLLRALVSAAGAPRLDQPRAGP
jgi:CBS domain-containing protein